MLFSGFSSPLRLRLKTPRPTERSRNSVSSEFI